MSQLELDTDAEEHHAHLQKVPAHFRLQFLTFIQGGDASDEFLAFLDRDAGTQQAVEAALAEEVRRFGRVVGDLNMPREALAAHFKDRNGNGVGETSANLINGVRSYAAMQPEQKDQVLSTITGSIEVSSFVDELDGLTQRLREEKI